MATREISRADWRSTFEDITQRYGGSPVTIEATAADIGAQPEVEGLPLSGITMGEKGADAGSILLSLGDRANDHVMHRVSAPTQVYLKEDAEGEIEVIELRSATDPTLLISLPRNM